MPFLGLVLGGNVALAERVSPTVEVQVRENPRQSIRISVIQGAHISPKLQP